MLFQQYSDTIIFIPFCILLKNVNMFNFIFALKYPPYIILEYECNFMNSYLHCLVKDQFLMRYVDTNFKPLFFSTDNRIIEHVS